MNKKIMKRILSGAMALALTCMSTKVFAEKNPFSQSTGGNYAIVDMNEYEKYLSSLSDEELKAIDTKKQIAKSVEKASVYSTHTSDDSFLIALPGNFPIYEQETNTYCVPACVQSALVYLTGSSPSQSSMNSYFEMDFTKIPNYVNARQDFFYSLEEYPTPSTLKTYIKADISNWEVPSFLRISGTTTDNWYYRTSGHCILACGIYNDLSCIRIADPLGGRVSGCPDIYKIDANIVAGYTTHLCW